MKKRLLIGVITIESHLEMVSEVLRGIIKQAFQCDCDIAVLSPVVHYLQNLWNEHRVTEKEIFKLILSERFDGFIYDRRFLSLNNELTEFVDSLLKRSGKTVMMVDSSEHPLFENTIADDCKPFEKIVTHLIEEHGYRKIYCLTGPEDSSPAQERLEGYFEAMTKHGLYYDESYYIYGDFWKGSAIQLGEEILSGRREKPEAVACGNDTAAATLIETLVHGGLRVPEDIAVTGFDYSVQDCNVDHTITSYKRANFTFGAETFRRLYRIITGRICKRVPNEVEGLHAGHSCGCSVFPKFRNLGDKTLRMQSQFDEKIDSFDMLVEVTHESSLEAILQRIADYTFWIYRISRFSICLTEDYLDALEAPVSQKLSFSYKQKMRLKLLRYSSGKTVFMDESFLAAEMLPEFAQPHRKPMAYYITPLHYHENFFGYAALTFGKYPMTYSRSYQQFIAYANTALEQFRVRMEMQHLTDSYCYDLTTGFPVLQMMIQKLLRQKSKGEITLLYLEITELKKVYSLNLTESFPKILRLFADCIRSCLQKQEMYGLISNGCFCIATPKKERTKEFFATLKEKIRFCHTEDGIRCNLSFCIGESSGRITDGKAFQEMLHNAVLNTVFTYIADKKTNSNPLFEKLCQLRSKMNQQPELPWNTDEICQKLHVSKSHLQKTYKLYVGKSIFDELITFRVEKAKRLLQKTNKTLTDVAAECGYASYCHFTKQFKKAEAISPSEYRRKFRK